MSFEVSTGLDRTGKPNENVFSKKETPSKRSAKRSIGLIHESTTYED